MNRIHVKPRGIGGNGFAHKSVDAKHPMLRYKGLHKIEILPPGQVLKDTGCNNQIEAAGRKRAFVDEAFPFGHVDRKSTRLNSSHLGISYAVFCLKKTHQALPPARRATQ